MQTPSIKGLLLTMKTTQIDDFVHYFHCFFCVARQHHTKINRQQHTKINKLFNWCTLQNCLIYLYHDFKGLCNTPNLSNLYLSYIFRLNFSNEFGLVNFNHLAVGQKSAIIIKHYRPCRQHHNIVENFSRYFIYRSNAIFWTFVYKHLCLLCSGHGSESLMDGLCRVLCIENMVRALTE